MAECVLRTYLANVMDTDKQTQFKVSAIAIPFVRVVVLSE
jgi:hypothetical protein